MACELVNTEEIGCQESQVENRDASLDNLPSYSDPQARTRCFRLTNKLNEEEQQCLMFSESNFLVAFCPSQSTEWVRVRVHQMEPDLMDVGSTLEEALQLQKEHEELMSRLKIGYYEMERLSQKRPNLKEEHDIL
ncbi:hypothetical protein RRG08_034494 [Elysia crispata]|uniref:Uncharacterized protein n=1 Tax=Elysia crispata TaxID=231223 RepID=A0AAE1BBB6_9GAST|nr:hypothetical protein RRG08_034494 [Elysia crispata]